MERTNKYFTMVVNATKNDTIQVVSATVARGVEFFNTREAAMERAENLAKVYAQWNHYVVMTGEVTAMVEAVPVTPSVKIVFHKQ